MEVRGGGACSYERGTPVDAHRHRSDPVPTRESASSNAQGFPALESAAGARLLITEFIKEGFAVIA